MQDNLAYNAVQESNLASMVPVYDTADASQTDARSVELVATHTIKKVFDVKNCYNFFIILLLTLAVVLSVIQLIITSNQEQKLLLHRIESSIQNTWNKTIDALRLELLELLVKQLPSQTEPTTTTTATNPSEVCGGPGWRRVAFIDMTDPNQNCPQGLRLTDYTSLYSIRLCGQAHTGSNCSSVTFPVDGAQYSQVCGRATAYRWGNNVAFYAFHSEQQTIDGPYVDGLSLTHGSPRTHIWTFASGLFSGTSENSHPNFRCPCDPGNTYNSPPFVRNDYFCESIKTMENLGALFYSYNSLWDGQDLLNSCYGFNNSPWFFKTLCMPTTNDIELRMCISNCSVFDLE